jgi:hypothetical protein
MAAESKPRLASHREAAAAELAREGSNRAVDGVVRWRRVDLAGVIKTRFNVTLADPGAGARPRSRSGEPVERVGIAMRARRGLRDGRRRRGRSARRLDPLGRRDWRQDQDQIVPSARAQEVTHLTLRRDLYKSPPPSSFVRMTVGDRGMFVGKLAMVESRGRVRVELRAPPPRRQAARGRPRRPRRCADRAPNRGRRVARYRPGAQDKCRPG